MLCGDKNGVVKKKEKKRKIINEFKYNVIGKCEMVSSEKNKKKGK